MSRAGAALRLISLEISQFGYSEGAKWATLRLRWLLSAIQQPRCYRSEWLVCKCAAQSAGHIRFIHGGWWGDGESQMYAWMVALITGVIGNY
jgi:hypothetical protein